MDADQASRSAIANAARRLLPFLCLCYAVNFLDWVNVGIAALSMNQDLGLTPSIFGTGAGIYLLFEVPSNLALQRFGARVWIARHHGELGRRRHRHGARRGDDELHRLLDAAGDPDFRA
jgi:nitrate/nitrite transporter NarK